ncbi:MAG: peptidoglycan D,D-transpeptidase FtsI family protein [Hyphomicrobiaceae bacterium]
MRPARSEQLQREQQADRANAEAAASPVRATGVLPPEAALRLGRRRLLGVALAAGIGFSAIAGQLVRLSVSLDTDIRTSSAEAIASSHSRPDIVDRNGRIIATDVAGRSLYADPAMLLDPDQATEALATVLPDLDRNALRTQLYDRHRRFVWIKRGLTPRQAQSVHDLGLPGIAFRRELRRIYPDGALVGHIVGQVDPDNRGISGLEKFLDDQGMVQEVHGAHPSRARPVRLSLDLGVQHALADVLAGAVKTFEAKGAAGIVMAADTGAVLGCYSWPPIDPSIPGSRLDPGRPDLIHASVFELGSIMKSFTVAMMLDEGLATLDKTYDVGKPLTFGRFHINDFHRHAGAMTVRDIFVRSSNVGSAEMALQAGAARQRAFLERIGLINPVRTEAGPVAAPLLPERWGEVETATIAFGHGLALAPMQVMASAASLVNGGLRVEPTYLAGATRPDPSFARVLSPATSRKIREIMRLNVTLPYGTGRRAKSEGYRVGGKTGTAEMPGRHGYRKRAVVSSFLSTFPADKPGYVVLIALIEPQPTPATRGSITASVNAAPVTAALVHRIAPILGVLPRRIARVK